MKMNKEIKLSHKIIKELAEKFGVEEKQIKIALEDLESRKNERRN